MVGDFVSGRKLGKVMARNDSRPASRLENVYKNTKNMRDLYEAGIKDGYMASCLDLTDVLFSFERFSLGKATVLQESNRHILMKVNSCAECTGGLTKCGCNYLAGFICGALRSIGKPATIEVNEVTCCRGSGGECVFMASW